MSVQTKITNLLNHITGSAGGWPTNTNIGILAGVDYIKEETTDNIYFNEMNTACGIYGSYNEQTASFDLIADYANEKGCTNAFVYGQDDSVKYNPSFFIQTPFFSDDNLLEIVSGSFDKTTFRTILNSSPESASLIPLFNTSSFSDTNAYHPDFVVKDASKDGTALDNTILFHKYNSSNPTYQNSVNSGSLIEKYIVPSGSTLSNQGYFKTTKQDYLLTPDRQILLKDKDRFTFSYAPKFILSGDRYHIQNALGVYSSPSGSEITMYDNSTKQVQDIEVGDVVKSCKPAGMPDEFFFEDWYDYSSTNLSGSVASGSVVVRTFSEDFYGYYLINGSIKIPVMKQAMMKGGRFFTKQGDTWSWQTPDNINVGNYFLDKDANEVEITSKTEVAQEDTFYSLDVENIDTYFTSDILVHNIPPGKCFTGDTMITLADGTYENIQKIKPGTEIKTYNEETGKLQNSVVGEITKIRHDNLVKYKFSDNTEIKATDDHPFYVGGDYKAPLEVGDEVLNDELNKVNVVKVEKLAYMQITYNIDNTNNGKNYFANRVLVSDESETE